MAFSNKRDRDHARADELLDQARKGEFGPLYTSDYVFDVVTTTLVWTGRPDLAARAGQAILGSVEDSVPAFVRLAGVDEGTFSTAWGAFRSGRFERLSFTDHTILAQVKELALDAVMSFDGGFDGLAKRIL